MHWLRAGFLPISTMILVAAAFIVPLPLYVERPGLSVALSPCVDIEDPAATAVAGEFLLLTISVLHATVVDVVAAAVDDEAVVSPQRSVIPPDVTVDTFFQQQLEEFRTTADVAAVVGLRAAGKPASISGDGARLVHIAGDSPAAAALERGDVVTQVDSEPVGTSDELRAAVRASEPGEALELTVRRGRRQLTVEVTPAQVDGVPLLGVIPETVRQRVSLPSDVTVRSGTVGGPSAGLMIALTVYDEVLPDVNLAAGRVIAGSGTLDSTGHVGAVGGIGMKVLAAERRGADVFLAPAVNVAAASAAVPPESDLQVLGVTSFEDARRALADSAGSAPPGDRAPAEDCPYDEA